MEQAQKQREQQRRAAEDAMRQRALKEKKDRAKEAYYASIKEKYAAQRLPSILESGEQKKAQAREQRLARQQQRERAVQQAERDLAGLRSMFERTAQHNKEKEEQQKREAELQKQRLARKNDRLARSFAQKRMQKEAGSASGSVDAGQVDYQSTPSRRLQQSRAALQPGPPSIDNSGAPGGPAQRGSPQRASKSAAKLGSLDQAANRRPPMPQLRNNASVRNQPARQARPAAQSPALSNAKSAQLLPPQDAAQPGGQTASKQQAQSQKWSQLFGI